MSCIRRMENLDFQRAEGGCGLWPLSSSLALLAHSLLLIQCAVFLFSKVGKHEYVIPSPTWIFWGCEETRNNILSCNNSDCAATTGEAPVRLMISRKRYSLTMELLFQLIKSPTGASPVVAAHCHYCPKTRPQIGLGMSEQASILSMILGMWLFCWSFI